MEVNYKEVVQNLTAEKEKLSAGTDIDNLNKQVVELRSGLSVMKEEHKLKREWKAK